jgi:hypothetical protein
MPISPEQRREYERLGFESRRKLEQARSEDGSLGSALAHLWELGPERAKINELRRIGPEGMFWAGVAAWVGVAASVVIFVLVLLGYR